MPKLSPTPTIDPTAIVTASTLGRYTEVGARSKVTESVFGDYSYVVHDAEIIYTTVGRFTSIAAHTRINPGNHPMERITQAHFTYPAADYFEGETNDDAFFDRRRDLAVTIGDDVWIGHGAVVLAGRSIGTGAVVGAGSVVTRDVAPFTIVAGNPAKPIRRRFSESVAERIEALAWWTWDHERLRRALPDFRALPVEAFLDRYAG
jgi:phosphonate metabolism protein (transferase hexapeptide repeat family)